MAQVIASVNEPIIEHATAVELTVNTDAGLTTFFLSNAASDIWQNWNSVTVISINTNTCATATPHLLTTGDRVVFATSGNGITADEVYYVKEATTPYNFTLTTKRSVSSENPVVTLTDGTGLTLTAATKKRHYALGGYLGISDIQSTIENTNYEINVSLSAIPVDFLRLIIGSPIKGGLIKIKRIFFDRHTQEIGVVDGVDQIFTRFNGIVVNFALEETFNIQKRNTDITYTISVSCSSVIGVIEGRLSGRRTNQNNYQVHYPELQQRDRAYTEALMLADTTMGRVEALKNASFDFGRKK